MSVSITQPESASSSFQPFQCQICQSRFTRHENLKRHAAIHSSSADEILAPCEFCKTTFSRRDLRQRHMKRKHPEQMESRNARKPQYESAAAKERRGGSRSQGSKTLSISPPKESNIIQPLASPNEVGMDMGMDSWVGQMAMPQLQPRMSYDTQNSMTLSDTRKHSTSTDAYAEEEIVHNIASWLIQQPSAREPRHVASSERDANTFEHNLLLDPSSFDSTYHFDDMMQQATESQPVFSDASSNGASPGSFIPDGMSLRDVSYLKDNWFPSPSQTARGYQLYFTHISHFVPFLHRPTFDATEISRPLGLSMLCLAFQHGEDPDCGEQAGSGAALALRCFHRARVVAAADEETRGDMSSKVTLVQAYWLLQVCAMMYLCGEDSAYGHKMHSRMISLTRFGGLTQPMPAESTATEDLDALWHEFIKAESHKRTLLAVHQIDALWYQLFSIPRLLSHLEIKHELPCREECWTATSPAQWAHRQLAARQSPPLVPYSDAVRRLLSPKPDIDSLPTFDLYGAINITQFLLSSAREVSGWATMTGRLSMERFEPLRTSLVALEHVIRPGGETAKSAHAATCEATWEMAMLELLVWSPSHTCGIVGGSVDSFLTQSTYLTSSCKNVYESATNEAVQPHIDWFLRYLDSTLTTDSEPPWISLYAYKAFLIAWQLVREGVPGAMQVVGVQDGNVVEAIAWAKKAFYRGQRPQLSRLITSCLDMLAG